MSPALFYAHRAILCEAIFVMDCFCPSMGGAEAMGALRACSQGAPIASDPSLCRERKTVHDYFPFLSIRSYDISSAVHVRPLRGLSTLLALYPRSLTSVVACFAAPPRTFDDLGSFMVEAAAKLPLLKNGVYICMVWYGLYCPRKRLDQLKK